MNPNKHIKKLNNAPLQEVIFEVRWELEIDEELQSEYDDSYDFALGVFAKKLEEMGFTNHIRLISPFIPRKLTNYHPQFRFKKVGQEYPLIQVGQGILTLNDNDDNYEWDDNYLPFIQTSLSNLFDSYKNKININFASIRYIDVVSLEEETDPIKFIKENLNYTINRNFPLEGQLSQVSIKEKYSIDEGDLRIDISTGRDSESDERRLIWQYTLSSDSNMDYKGIISWVIKARKITSNLFRTMLNEKFYGSFK